MVETALTNQINTFFLNSNHNKKQQKSSPSRVIGSNLATGSEENSKVGHFEALRIPRYSETQKPLEAVKELE